MRTATALLALALLALATSAMAEEARAEPLDLEGAWYVLVHFRDASEDPEAQQWEDRVWVFEPRGSRLRWTEYESVLFRDDRGRYEKLAGGRKARTLRFWEPTDEQREEIEKRLEVSSRGSRTKSLRGDGRGYRSSESLHSDSTSVVGYSEIWEVRDLDALPSFVRNAQMSSARAESLEGITSFATREIYRGGEVLEGVYERDLVRRGSFKMMRAGRIEVLGNKQLRKRGFDE